MSTEMRIIISFLNTPVVASMRLVIVTVVSVEISASIFRIETVLKKLLDPEIGGKKSFREIDNSLTRQGVISQKT